MDIEKSISAYIDALNEEKEPEGKEGAASPDLERLFKTVRLVRTLKEPAMPDSAYPQRLVKIVASRLHEVQSAGALCRNRQGKVGLRAAAVVLRLQRRWLPVLLGFYW